MNANNNSSGFRQAQARLNMRKGTKSCSECRRRKTKCTYRGGRLSRCDECYARGTPCLSQDKGPKTTPAISVTSTNADGKADEAKYSLRERVARLEDFVEAYLRNESTTKSSISERNRNLHGGRTADTDPTPDEQAPTSTNGRFRSNPILSLLNNGVITRTSHAANPSPVESAASTEPSGFHPARFELLTLLPREPDLNTLIELSKDWWSSSPHRFPELFDREATTAGEWRSVLNHELSLANPAATAKVFLWTVISAERLNDEIFHDGTFRDPTAVATLESRVLPAIDRAVVFQEDVATTLPGIECLVLLSRYYCNQGGLRKAWHLCRRAIEYAISIGLDRLPSVYQNPIPSDHPHHRQIALWEAICFLDRYLSLLLGFPYGVRHSPLVSLKEGIESPQPNPQQATFFYAAMSSIIGRIIDRNQEQLDDHHSLLRTLKIDQELKQVMDNVDTLRWDADSSPSNPQIPEALERVEAYFLMHFIRALLHLPLMLKCIGKRDKGIFQFSYGVSTSASRQALIAYKYLRVGLRIDSYLCAMLDFQAFTMSVLLVLHLVGQKTESNEEPSREYAVEGQDERDWKSVVEVTDILRRASTDHRKSTVAQQAVAVLDLIVGAKDDMDGRLTPFPQPEADLQGEECQVKITVPCFGEITVVKGAKGTDCCLYPRASANTVDSPRRATTSLPPLTGQADTIFNPSDLGPITVSTSPDAAALFDGNWSVLATNVASTMAAHPPRAVYNHCG
ncbi:hypothetical protein AYL99_06645 [Fonsecaea erecta]|uniref:Zn(2)-C6 fungal-type domain-containing protein n=1 Tax=Fonsecaea erecta TaxID=1367422 RepID=A0A178ZHR4_9EURO|nr:hypothetical protein AYL99_06645 [Fonsecaea erecta]OAP59347.1 hypothetical protein AYL99_06645 [Fonsecaea erecta]